jgi:transcriptional regulator with XRE-family HTH domain
MVQIHQLFKQAMDKHGISSKHLAEIAGISQNHLSQFRSGNKWVSPEVFAELLKGMDKLAPGSRRYFCELLANEPLGKEDTKSNIEKMIDSADDDEIEAVLLAIGRKWKKTRQNAAITSAYDTDFSPAIAV